MHAMMLHVYVMCIYILLDCHIVFLSSNITDVLEEIRFVFNEFTLYFTYFQVNFLLYTGVYCDSEGLQMLFHCHVYFPIMPCCTMKKYQPLSGIIHQKALPDHSGFTKREAANHTEP